MDVPNHDQHEVEFSTLMRRPKISLIGLYGFEGFFNPDFPLAS